MNKHDKQAIEELKQFAIIMLQKRIEEADLSYEEEIKQYLASWEEKLNVSEMGK